MPDMDGMSLLAGTKWKGALKLDGSSLLDVDAKPSVPGISVSVLASSNENEPKSGPAFEKSMNDDPNESTVS